MKQKMSKIRGAALLMAMLTLVLVATLAAGAASLQWRSVETERSERMRSQAGWLLLGSLDWAHLILREDARKGGPDGLSEPWAVALQESRLSSFLSADATSAVLLADQANDNIFLSGQIQDMQARLNVFNLAKSGSISPNELASFNKLFDLLDLNTAELTSLADNMRFATDTSSDNLSADRATLMPQRPDQLALLGLSPTTLERLRPFIAWLPTPTSTLININTASPEVLYASVPGLDLEGAQKIVAARSQPFKTLADVGALLPALAAQFNAGGHSVASNYFEITGRLRLADGDQSTVIIERSVVERNALTVRTLWRERGSFPIAEGGISAEQMAATLR
jgi:general secretion pathway protein K